MPEAIAVVGSSCRFPGGSSSPSKLWQLLKDPRDVLRDIPKDRLNLSAFYHEDGEHHGCTNVVNKAYLLEEDPRTFDAPFFNINPMEADAMDPQQRLLLESVYECIEAAGYPLTKLQGSATSVYVGCMTNDYHDIQGRDMEVINRYHGTGSTHSILSNRISYFFDFRGPSVTMDTACSSSLAALHFAVQSLRSGESTSSIVGGVNLIFDSVAYISESKLHMLSPTSRSSMWDASADGYARGEGVSTIMLKTLSQALADGDHVECIIRETGMNQDGRTTGLTMPSAEAQATLIRQTYARAGLDLRLSNDRPQYFEAHGTGTQAGDPQEARGIYEAFFNRSISEKSGTENEEKLYCGSIKTVIGHLEGCAGLAGLLKASLAVQHGVVPPNLLFSSLNPDIEPYYQRLQIPTSPVPWPATAAPRRASVNSFGFGGTNVHAIIEQYIPKTPPTTTTQHKLKADDFFAGPLLLSACTAPSLAANIDFLADWLARSDNNVELEDLALFTQTRRSTLQQRVWFPGGTWQQLLDSLRSSTASNTTYDVGVRAPAKLKWHTPGILGIFTGQGAQWAGMGRHLVNRCHRFRQSIESCEAALRGLPDAPTWSLMQEILLDEAESRLHEAALSQPLCTAVQIALVDTLAAAGITFRGVVGHSSGEIAATYAAGLLSAEDAMRVAYYRGLHAHLARGVSGQPGAMLAVGLGIDDAETFCEAFKGRISVAASNSPTSATLSGDEDAIYEAKEMLEKDKKFARLLKVDTAYHSSHMLPCAKPYLDSLKACKIRVHPQNDECIWISSVHGHAELLDDPDDLSVLADEYWVANMCQPVLFSEAVECSLWRAGPFDLAIEVGAHPALKGPAAQTMTAVLGSNASLPYTATLQRGHNDLEAFSAALGSLWTTLGDWVNFKGWRKAYFGPDCADPVGVVKGLPSYSWTHEQKYWKESRLSSRYRLAERAPHELLGRRAVDDSDNEMRWRNIMKVKELPWVKGHVFQKAILFPTTGYVALAIEAAAEIVGSRRVKLIELRDLVIPRALVLEDNHEGVETVFSLRRQAASSDTIIEADFSCHSSVSNGPLEKNCSGRVIIELFSADDNLEDDNSSLLPARCQPRSGTTSIDGEAYYQAILNTTGLDYQGLFRGMKHIRRTHGFSCAEASWPAEDVGSHYHMHPGLLDVALQAILAAFVNPTRIPIRGSFLPSALSRLVFDPNASALSNDGKQVVFESDCFLTNNTPRSCEGDIHVFGPSGQCLLQVEGFRMDNWAELSAAQDRPVFSRLSYKPDIFYANTNDLIELIPDAKEERLIEAINRASLFYLRTIFSNLTEADVADWTWDRQAFYKATKKMLELTSNGKHPTAQKSWLQDNATLMEEYKNSEEFKDQADMRAVHVAGEHLAKVMAGEERALEVYLREGVWAPLYSHGRYQIRLNRTIADLVKSFSHRYPRANILEVGAGSGGTTVGVLSHIGDAIGKYTFTDVSAGFFEKARERLADCGAAAERVEYKVLDIERDPLEQGFEEASQDVIIAANVLHATTDLGKAVENVRRLLKPGGYLFMLEVTGEYLEGLLLMGPLEGWWLGNREGEASQPGLGLHEWDELLRNTGFTGVDKHQSDVPDLDAHAVSVIVSQATDSRVNMLREPFEHLDDLPITDQVLIIGGATLQMSKTVRTIAQHVARFAGNVQIVQSIDKIDPDTHLAGPVSVIALCELERPFFADAVEESRLRKLQALFKNATDVLWVTTGHLDDQDPSSAMTIGLCRTVVTELDHLNLQFLNTVTKGSRSPDTRFIVEAFARLKLNATASFTASPILWSNEPELTLAQDGEVLIPRLMPDIERNERLNSAARHISKHVQPTSGHQYTAIRRNDSIELRESSPWLLAPTQASLEDVKTVRTLLSTSLPGSKKVTLISGMGEDDKHVLALTQLHSSTVSAPSGQMVQLETGTPCTAQQLRHLALQIVAKQVLATIPLLLTKSKAIIHNASGALARAISGLAGDKVKLVFTETDIGAKPAFPGAILLHPRASSYILRRALPPNVDFVVSLTEGDAVANRLLATFRGRTIDLDSLLGDAGASILEILGGGVDRVEDIDQLVSNEDPTPLPAHRLSHLPASALDYPAVVDWKMDAENPLQITVQPISGQGLFSSDKSYLMVSLVSTLGRSICRWMIENGARHIALASRSAKVDPQWLEEMAHLGADVRVYRMDVSDKQSVKSTVATMRAEMPPIAGVANAALVLRDRLFLDMDAADMNEVLAPKVDGSRNLHEEFSEAGLDFFILFSTLSCVIGNPGQSNYDAASLYQVMLAKHRRQQGLAASVMEIGCVADVGYVAEQGQWLFDKLARTMKLPLSEPDVHQVFAEAVAASPVREGEVVDSTTAELVTGMGHYTYDVGTPIEARPPWFNNLLASHYVREERGKSVVATGSDGDHQTVSSQLDSITSEEAASAVLVKALASRVATMLQMAPGSFKVDASLLDVGIDSLLAVELRTWFLKEIHVDVPVLKILSGETGEAICAFAASQYLAEKSKSKSNSVSIEERQGSDVGLSATSSEIEDTAASGSSDLETISTVTTVSSDDGQSTKEAEEQAMDVASNPPILAREGPMTHAQARLWIADHISSNPTQNNNMMTYGLSGYVNVARLQRALATVVAHHSGLQTCFFENAAGTPRQGHLERPPQCFQHVPIIGNGEDNALAVQKLKSQLEQRQWDLERGEALQVILISHNNNRHTLLIGYHHIAMDGTAWRTFFRDLHLAYQGELLPLPGKQPIDVADAQHSSVATEAATAVAMSYWKERLHPALEPLPLLPFALVGTRPPLDGFANHKSMRPFDCSVASGIRTVSASFGVTSTNLYLATTQLLLSRLTGSEEICIGITDTGRDVESVESIGFFLNLLPLRLRTARSQTLQELVQQANEAYREAQAHSNVPLQDIIESAGVGREPTHTPLFQVGFDVRYGGSAEMPLGNCRLRIQEATDSALPYDLSFCITPMLGYGPSYVQVLTRRDLYSQEATDLLAEMYITLLESVVKQGPGANTPLAFLDVYPADRVQKALEFGVSKAIPFSDWPATLTERIERVSQNSDSDIAVRDDLGTMTYAELMKSVIDLAASLVRYQHARIAVLCAPGRHWVIGMLATLRTGATFISLDATLPPSRLASMIQVCEPSVVLCHYATNQLATQVVHEACSAASILRYEEAITPDETVHLGENLEDSSRASFILCTSGSTGVPKAILLSSRGFINYLANASELLGIQKGDVILQQSNLGFDMALAQALLAVTHGCTLAFAPQSSRGDPVAVTDLMVRERVSVTFACPTEYLMWLRYSGGNLARLTSWRLALCGGEKVTEALRHEIRDSFSNVVFSDCYGPTEVSVCATIQHPTDELSADPLAVSATSVGRPLGNVAIFIVDSQGDVCPPGIPGEICISGAGVALGYVGATATAAGPFIDSFDPKCGNGNTYTTERMYKTGDRGVWRSDGTLGFLGRMDDSSVVKIRGLRVDLGDVETTILSHASLLISDAVVTFHRDEDDASLVAHVVPRQEALADLDDSKSKSLASLQVDLEHSMYHLPLPRHMHPSHVVLHERLPMSANGKVDRRQLARAPLPTRHNTSRVPESGTSLTTLKQAELLLLWNRVLNRSDIPRRADVDFWALGASSLHLVKLQAAIRSELQVSVPIRDMFMHSTLGAMSDLVEARSADTATSTIGWNQETKLTDELKSALSSADCATPSIARVASEVLLTGVESFLGSHILRALLRDPHIKQVHCIAVPAQTSLPQDIDSTRIRIYEGNLHDKNLGLSTETINHLVPTIDRIILAGSHGHCLNNYTSLRQPNVQSTKVLATWAARHHIPLHFISSNRVTLLDPESHAALSPISVADHTPHPSGSEGLAASKWVSEVFLERLAKAMPSLPIMIHRPCALISTEANDAPSTDSLNAILRYSDLMSAVPRTSILPITGYFDFAPVDRIAKEISDAAIHDGQVSGLRFMHHSGGVKVPPTEFTQYMEKVYDKEFEELDLEQWIERALGLGIEPIIAVYLRAVMGGGGEGKQLVFPYMGAPSPLLATTAS